MASVGVDLVRTYLDDVSENPRFTSDEINEAIDNACQRLSNDRPDLSISSNGSIADATTVGNLPDEFAPAVLAYTLYLMFMKDAEDTHNAQVASIHLQEYRNAIS